MPVNKFETVLSGKGQVDGYYKYNQNDEVLSVGININQYATWEITEEDYRELLSKAVLHHKEVVDARKHRHSAYN